MSDVYRSVNKYIDHTTGEEHIEYGKSYDKPGLAKQYATRLRYPNGKGNKLKTIGNQFHLEDVSKWGGTYKSRVYDTYFEFVDTWCERAKEWETV